MRKMKKDKKDPEPPCAVSQLTLVKATKKERENFNPCEGCKKYDNCMSEFKQIKEGKQ